MPAIRVGKRKFDLGIWWLGLGYFVFYIPYSGLTKAISSGLLSGMKSSVSGFELLPVSVAATAIGMMGFITVAGWWKYAIHRPVMGVSLPLPSRWTLFSGLCLAIIIATTTLAFSFSGSSIVFVLVLLRGGVLIMGPIIDSLMKRNVRWFSLTAMLVSLVALLVALADGSHYTLAAVAVLNIAAYLASYFFRFRLMTRLAKSSERDTTLRYFVEEQIVATPALLATLACLAWIGTSDTMMAFRRGFMMFLDREAIVPALLVGLSYAALCVCTTLIFLDRRENTFCIPMHCGSSMLSGVVATSALSFLYDQRPTSTAQYTSAALIVIALAFLSPLHHLKDKLQLALAEGRPRDLIPGFAARKKASGTPFLQRVFLFVCSGNTSRSPMAQAICNKEIASLLKISMESPGLRAISTGLSALPGAPMTPDARLALARLGVEAHDHSSSKITDRMVRQADVIFCMTREQQAAIIEAFPSAAPKTHCLDPDGDIEDPTGAGPEAFFSCARNLQDLIRRRFQEMGLVIPNGPWAWHPQH